MIICGKLDSCALGICKFTLEHYLAKPVPAYVHQSWDLGSLANIPACRQLHGQICAYFRVRVWVHAAACLHFHSLEGAWLATIFLLSPPRVCRSHARNVSQRDSQSAPRDLHAHHPHRSTATCHKNDVCCCCMPVLKGARLD
jgi:hypothetical protein